MSDEDIIRKIVHYVFWNDRNALHKSLWRQSGGSRTEAFKIVRGVLEHHGLSPTQIQDYHIECAMARLNDGVEVEWESV
jgi:hypothetical protein